MFDVAGFILVGGQSRRMGQDKAELPFDGCSALARIANLLGGVAMSVALVGARRQYPGVDLPNVPDFHQSWGVLGGIHAALLAAESEWILVVACDLPFVTSELFERLKSFVANDVDALVPIQPDGRPQPVCALYRRETCLRKIEKLIAAGEHTPRVLLASLRTRYVEFSELSDLPGARRFFFNVNTPADFQHAQELLAGN